MESIDPNNVMIDSDFTLRQQHIRNTSEGRCVVLLIDDLDKLGLAGWLPLDGDTASMLRNNFIIISGDSCCVVYASTIPPSGSR
jgi:hypothetical protein